MPGLTIIRTLATRQVIPLPCILVAMSLSLLQGMGQQRVSASRVGIALASEAASRSGWIRYRLLLVIYQGLLEEGSILVPH